MLCVECYESKLTSCSSLPTSCTPSANLSRKKAPSRSEALFKLQACRSTFWTSPTNTRHCALHSRVMGQKGEFDG